MTDKQEVNAYGFAEFCKETEKLIQAGYKFDFESNAGFPTAFGTFFNAILVKDDSIEQQAIAVTEPAQEPVQDESPAVLPADTPVPKAGRPKKS